MTAGDVGFAAMLQRPATPPRAGWAFVVLPEAASTKLPSRGMVSVDGTLAGTAFHATLSPDGEGGHWLKLPAALLRQAGVEAGMMADIALAPVAKEPEPRLPADLKRALAANAAALATWRDITATARRDWIHWITSGKQAETRPKRIGTAIDKLAKGERRACCFDRSGIYSRGNMGVPAAAAR